MSATVEKETVITPYKRKEMCLPLLIQESHSRWLRKAGPVRDSDFVLGPKYRYSESVGLTGRSTGRNWRRLLSEYMSGPKSRR